VRSEDDDKIFGELETENLEWKMIGRIPQDNKERLAFYDKLFFEAWKRHVKLELIVDFFFDKDFYLIKKRQITTYDQKLG
jgi:hypothetical protein